MNEEIARVLGQAAEDHRQGRFQEAETGYLEVLSSDARQADALHLLGVLKSQQGEHREGIALIRRAILQQPKSGTFYKNLAVIYEQQGDRAARLEALSNAVRLDPSLSDAVITLAKIHEDDGKVDRANAVLAEGLAATPTNWRILFAIGLLANKLGKTAQALEYLQLALGFGGNAAVIQVSRGAVFQRLDILGPAIECYKQALSADPTHARAVWALAIAKRAACDDGVESVVDEIRRDPARFAGVATPFEMLTLTSDRSLLHTVARNWIAAHAPAQPQPLCSSTETTPRSKLRIGYLSDELREHAMGRLLGDFFAQHDRSRFHVAAYYFGLDERSVVQQKLRKDFDRWVDLPGASPLEIAQRIREDNVDILVDLKAHVAGARPQIAAYRPAPLQVNWLAFPGTMGADYIDYLIADDVVLPEEHAIDYSESIAWLPCCYQVNDPLRPIADSSASRTSHGLPAQGFVFCCFNQLHKVTPHVFEIWMRLLREMEDSCLWLIAGPAEAQMALRRRAEACGVAAGRIVFAPKLPHTRHLARYRLADLFLDTSPYGAHATASDALWAGVPFVTQLGDSFANRVGASLLRAVNLEMFVAKSEQDYFAIALQAARHPEVLDEAKRRLRENRASLPLFDSAGFARYIESAFQTMWERQTSGQPPASFRVEAR